MFQELLLFQNNLEFWIFIQIFKLRNQQTNHVYGPDFQAAVLCPLPGDLTTCHHFAVLCDFPAL